jgi:hypothetical protein
MHMSEHTCVDWRWLVLLLLGFHPRQRHLTRTTMLFPPAAREAGVPREGCPHATSRRRACGDISVVWTQLQRRQQPLHRAAQHRAARAVLPRASDEH